ncbi:MAG: 3-dehydroquinate synthase [Fibrobacteres bacterium]|nr:3-dehydroquinate synthase [Fibrobacterota bacterium]
MKKISVNLGSRSYTISVDEGIAERLPGEIKKFKKAGPVLLLTDTNVAKIHSVTYKKLISSGCIPFAIPAGEKSKTFEMAGKVLSYMMKNKFDRHSLLVAFGGGVVGDLGGFVSALFMRGIPFIQIPTTLLSQVDSSVGGKTGVNHPLGKNIIGAFHQPKAVFIDPAFLKTLTNREFLNGYAEVVKHGLIRDAALFRKLENRHDDIMKRKPALMAEIVARNCAIKAGVVEKDETEKSLRAILNFGHTFGHAVETVTGYKTYSHGEAVMLGMRAAVVAGVHLGITAADDAARMFEYFKKCGMPSLVKSTTAKVHSAMFADKKAEAGKLNIIAIEKIGKAVIVNDPDSDAVIAGVRTMINKG